MSPHDHDRLRKLPPWAQEEIRKLRHSVAFLEDVEKRLLAELSGVEAEESDTMLQLPESGTARPLGDGVPVRFGESECGKGLVVDTDGDMAILPTFDPRQILIIPAPWEGGGDGHR